MRLYRSLLNPDALEDEPDDSFLTVWSKNFGKTLPLALRADRGGTQVGEAEHAFVKGKAGALGRASAWN